MNDTNQSPEYIIEKLNQALLELSSKEHTDSLRTLNFHSSAAESLYGKGITWTGKGPIKQLIFSKPDSFWSSEHFDLAPGKSYYAAGSPVLNQNSLGHSVVKSNLKELGRLNGLIVDGSISVAQHLYYDSKNKSLGLGTEKPNAVLDIVKDNTNLILDVLNKVSRIGSKSSNDLELITSDIPRMVIGKEGTIQIGDKNNPPIQMIVNGKISVKVEHPDPNVDLHVNGPVKINGRLHANADRFPSSGVYQQGDIYWNSNPIAGKPIGWVCTKSGNPGIWASFGIINHLG
jgi:hypothetical protein